MGRRSKTKGKRALARRLSEERSRLVYDMRVRNAVTFNHVRGKTQVSHHFYILVNSYITEKGCYEFMVQGSQDDPVTTVVIENIPVSYYRGLIRPGLRDLAQRRDQLLRDYDFTVKRGEDGKAWIHRVGLLYIHRPRFNPVIPRGFKLEDS